MTYHLHIRDDGQRYHWCVTGHWFEWVRQIAKFRVAVLVQGTAANYLDALEGAHSVYPQAVLL